MSFYDMLKAAALAGGAAPSPTPPSPFPEDCPFTCDPDYFMDTEQEWTINGVTYKKYTDDYAVGLCTQLNAGGTWTGPVIFSPVSEDAVKYYVGGSLEGSVGGTVTLDGKTWYYSISYGQSGAYTAVGLPMSQYSGMDYPFSAAQLAAFLAEADAQNK